MFVCALRGSRQAPPSTPAQTCAAAARERLFTSMSLSCLCLHCFCAVSVPAGRAPTVLAKQAAPLQPPHFRCMRCTKSIPPLFHTHTHERECLLQYVHLKFLIEGVGKCQGGRSGGVGGVTRDGVACGCQRHAERVTHTHACKTHTTPGKGAASYCGVCGKAAATRNEEGARTACTI